MCEQKLAMEDGPKPFYPHTVDSSKRSGVVIKMKLRGLTPEQFYLVYAEPYDALGYKASLCPDVLGERFQGIVVVGDGTVKHEGADIGVPYRWYMDVSVGLEEEKMPSPAQLRNPQALDTFNWLCKPVQSGGGEDPLMKLMRLSAVKPDDIKSRGIAKRNGDYVPPEGRGWRCGRHAELSGRR